MFKLIICKYCLHQNLVVCYNLHLLFNEFFYIGRQWLMPVMLATQEAEIRRIKVRSQPRQVLLWDPISKKPITKKSWWNGSRCRPWVQALVLLKNKTKPFMLVCLLKLNCFVFVGFIFYVLTTNFFLLIFIFLLFICACNVWVISPPCLHPLPYHLLHPLPLPPNPSVPSRNYFALISNFVEERV
jgi:hypothetical protein